MFSPPWIGSYSRQLSSGVLLNLHTMIKLHTSLACLPWQHLATACFRQVAWSDCLKGHYPRQQSNREVRMRLLSCSETSSDFAVFFSLNVLQSHLWFPAPLYGFNESLQRFHSVCFLRNYFFSTSNIPDMVLNSCHVYFALQQLLRGRGWCLVSQIQENILRSQPVSDQAQRSAWAACSLLLPYIP